MGTSVVVVGSGAAGLAAALAAADAGATVTVLERAPHLGGTTAISGGVAWIPASDVARTAGVDDSPTAALTYLRALGLGDYDDAPATVFAHDAARVARTIEATTPIEWVLLPDWPDYQSHLPGGLAGGRSIWPAPLAAPPDLARRIQPTPEVPDLPDLPVVADAPVTDAVVLRGPVRGRALVAGLAMALSERGVELRTGARVRRLDLDGQGGVRGVVLDRAESVPGAVVLATGGFQHDAALARTFLPAPGIAALGPPGCAGDGLRMALGAGAALGNMADAWWMPAIRVPGETIDDAPFYRPLHHERAQPGSLMVDREGRRFVDEAQNYCDAGRAMLRFDPGAYGWPAAPAWLVFDRAYRERTAVGPLAPGGDDPDWLIRAASVAELGAAIGVDPATLTATVDRFNRFAAAGHDPDFGRGAHPYDRWIGDAAAPHPNLAPLGAAPFYALEVLPGCLGTKGGPRTDVDGRVLRADGASIPGLFAAGNAAASPFGIGTPGGGGTIGPALVFGTRAGEAAAT